MSKTTENLEEALAGEMHEYKTMYLQMITDAKEEGEQCLDYLNLQR
jgi:rubrerythrin